MSDLLDKQYIKSLIQEILDKNHTNPNKRKILEFNDKLNFACPICGDSQKLSHKKRGNLYWKNMMYICYNDDSSACNRSFLKLLSTFGIQMNMESKIKMYEYIDKNIDFKPTSNLSTITMNNLISIDKILEFYNGRTIERGLSLVKPLDITGSVYKYVKNVRKVYNTDDIYEGIYVFTPTWSQKVMVFVNRLQNKVISLQIRNMLDGDKRYFKVIDFSMLHNEMYPEIILDEQIIITYNKLSHFFNIFNIDFTRTIYLLEGYMDSLFINNAIGQIGINTDITFLLNEDGIELKFIYDNDKAGFKKAEKMLMEGHKVFLWNKLFIYILKKYKGNKKEMCQSLKEIKDFNKLYIKLGKPIEKIFNIDDFFSNDKLDKLYFMDLDKIMNIL
jgi:hypothetical protein